MNVAMQARPRWGAFAATLPFIERGFQVADFFPEAADLPEGMSDSVMAEKYGGVGGEGYLQMIQEIERRIASCPAYRP